MSRCSYIDGLHQHRYQQYCHQKSIASLYFPVELLIKSTASCPPDFFNSSAGNVVNCLSDFWYNTAGNVADVTHQYQNAPPPTSGLIRPLNL